MHLERHLGRPANGLDHDEPVGELRHEPAIHDVEVQGEGSGLLQSLHFAGQMAKIAKEQGGKHHGAVVFHSRRQLIEGVSCRRVHVCVQTLLWPAGNAARFGDPNSTSRVVNVARNFLLLVPRTARKRFGVIDLGKTNPRRTSPSCKTDPHRSK